MNFQTQSASWLKHLSTRKKNPVESSTLRRYESALHEHLLPAVGEKPLSEIGNRAAKELVEKLALSPSSIQVTLYVLKAVVASAIDADGNEIYPVKWNADFIDAPTVQGQKTPELPLQLLSKLLSRSWGEDRALYALLAGTGMRICEALDLTTEDDGETNWYNAVTGTIYIRRSGTKTDAGVRVIDLHPDLNILLQSLVGNGKMFKVSESTARRRMRDHVDIGDFHRFRRFRATHLDKMNVPEGLKKFWLGHSNAGDITARYVKIGNDVKSRIEWATKTGLGFNI